MDIFNEMISLQQKVWVSRGKGGSSSNSFFYDFHKNIIEKRFVHGEIQLLRVKAGSENLACLNNLVYKKKVFAYQSGINYHSDSRFKPGVLAHLAAIVYNSKLGDISFDFLAGEDLYKKRLATDYYQLVWARIQKPFIKFHIENNLAKLKRYFYDLKKQFNR